MSVVTETTKTAFEIYQPVIVGLGVVALGFLANSALEWWKAQIQRKRQSEDIRKSIYLEGSIIAERSRVCARVLGERGASTIALRLSSFFEKIDPTDLACLSIRELDKLGNFLAEHEEVRAILMAEKDAQREGLMVAIRVSEEDIEFWNRICSDLCKSAEQAIAEIKPHIT